MEKRKLSAFVIMKQKNAAYCDKPTDAKKRALDKSIEKYAKSQEGKKTKAEIRDIIKAHTGCKVK